LGIFPEAWGSESEALKIADLAGIATRYSGRVVGDGHCVAFVREVCDLPPTTRWRTGEQVRGNVLAPGVAIATFEAGRYGNKRDGGSHCAVFVEAQESGILVWDQWLGRVVGSRVIRYRGGKSLPVDDGDAYWVIEVGK